MAYEPLHHKYRPRTFAELVGQEAIATTLSNALRQQKIAPAYLFTGARGTGKTSSARILAKSLNCLKADRPTETPCGVCEACRTIANGNALDVIEIDAASNTGVDNIRELIERAQFAPVQCRYKVYAIDECHMLSTAAFNALLKTLEEPPDRVVFVLATTDPQRVLPTIISRCQRFDFRRIELAAMVRHLNQIAKQEAIDIAPDAVQLVAQMAQGGMRDAESMLDQLSLLEGQITVERVWDLVGAVPERSLLALVQAVAQNDATSVIDQVRELMDRGREPLIVLQNLASFYRDLLIAKTTPDRNDLVAVTSSTWAEMCAFVQSVDLRQLLQGQQLLRASEGQIKNTTQPRLWLEVTLIGLLPANLLLAQASAHQASAHQLPTSQSPAQPTRNQVIQPFQPIPPIQQPPARPAAEPSKPAKPAAQPEVKPPEVKPPEVKPPEQPADEPELIEVEVSELDIIEEAGEFEVSQSEAAAVLSAATANSMNANSMNLEQVWQAVIDALQPPGTRELFRQQGSLLALEAQFARIGISSKPLFKMAQLRVANLETALAQVAQHPVKVSLEVTATPDPSASAQPASAQPVPLPPNLTPQQDSNGRGSSHGSSSGNGAGTGSHSSYHSSNQLSNHSSSPVTHAGRSQPLPRSNAVSEAATPYEADPPSAPSDAAPVWLAEDEVTRAAKSLAQMFNGQIVSGAEDLASEDLASVTESNRLEQTLEQTVSEPEDGDPDDDVPF